MSLFVSSLNSGSNGNCYYVGNGQEAVLIDAGISCRETEKRMKRLGLSMDTIKAVFITHEHGDHIKGLETLASRYRMPVYITPLTLQHSRLRIDNALIFSFEAYQPVTIGSLRVLPFPKQHDASNPHSFVIEGGGIRIGVFTDIGSPCKHVIDHFKQCHAAFLEANYDEVLLAEGRYPPHLKKRISGDEGHLSNRQALELFTAHKPCFMTHLFLCHLSKENNCPGKAYELFNTNAGSTRIIVASRYEETAVYAIFDHNNNTLKAEYPRREMVQMSMF